MLADDLAIESSTYHGNKRVDEGERHYSMAQYRDNDSEEQPKDVLTEPINSKTTEW